MLLYKNKTFMNFLKTKYLTPVCLLIFFMPFLRMCEVQKTEIVTAENTAYDIDSLKTDSGEQKPKNLIDNEITVKSEFGLAKIDLNLNAYHLGFGIFKTGFGAETLEEKELSYSLISYSFIILFSVLMMVLSWLKKYLWVRNLAIVNISLLIISTLLLVKSGFIDEFGDVKYGVYVFLLYSVFIIFTAQKEQNNSELNES